MKVILEFTDDERQQAEDAFHGTSYKVALVTIREKIRGTLKWAQLTKEQQDAWEEIRKDFYEITSHLDLES